jgi:hypothetical protein
MRFVFLGALLLSAAACTEPQDGLCKSVCEKEGSCADTRDNYRFDPDECISACTALMRDKEGKAYVERHKACVDQAPSCDHLYNKCTFAYEAPGEGK